ncbi:MAG: phosphate ABC transporter permease [Candidatus Magasanikbacteria bacterium RIFOXYC12_FULL_33_11]|uniref:Transport permease protein n=1 Tax=Candidatus Magasanikbacteria bacterium RIFOXYC12_FULL_33_11 TaxID=1798701 RepID=A0A1F6NM57_9BACT|nr:MAG: phosphate ABC transporter permease [Candidatus Magasanikbacteria bacterium RIFOXYC12_FULL_33_11]
MSIEIIIKPKNKWWQLDLKEIWQFRDLFYFFTWRDLKVKYKQTVVGVAWAIFQPFITMVIFSIFFGNLAKMPSDGIPYPIFVYTGLLFWLLFSSGLSSVSGVFIANEKIVTKIYFPRIILPISSIITNIVDFFIASVVLIGMMVYYQYAPSIVGLLLVLPLILMSVFSVLGVGLFFGALNVKYRDVRFVLPFFIQILMFVTPVIYPVSVAPEKYKWLLGINPMSGIIDTARSGLLGIGNIDWTLLGVSAISMCLYCFIGFFYFKKVERYFADVI